MQSPGNRALNRSREPHALGPAVRCREFSGIEFASSADWRNGVREVTMVQVWRNQNEVLDNWF